jgi:hypothetical protein
MSTAADRKKAREIYLATLNQQRDEAAVTAKPSSKPPGPPVAYSSREEKLNAREKMLEEKRQKFLQKSGKLSSGDNNNNDNNGNGNGNGNGNVAGNVPRFQPPQQQQQQQQEQHRPPQQPVENTAPPTSLQYGKHGDDGADTLAGRYGKKDDPVYRPKPKKIEVIAAPPLAGGAQDDDPFHDRQGQSSAPQSNNNSQRDPFAHTIQPEKLQSVNNGGGGLGSIGEKL